MRTAIAVVLALSLASSASAQSPGADRLSAGEGRAAEGETVMVVLNPVAADQRGTFESFVESVFWPSADRLGEADREVFRWTRVLYPTAPEADGTYLYAFIMDPLVPGGDYEIESLLRKAYGDEEGAAHYRTYEATRGGPQRAYTMTQSRN